LVVIAQAFYHNWRAYVADRPTALLRANHAFQAVEVPAGRHDVVLVYRDGNLRIGFAVSMFTALGCVLLWLRASRQGVAEVEVSVSG